MVKKMLRKQIPFFVAICLLVGCVWGASAQSQQIVLGGKSGWNSFSVMDSVVLGGGRFGYDALVLASDSSTVGEYTDALISFEDNQFVDQTGHYSVTSANMDFTDLAIMGKGAGVNRGVLNSGIKLNGDASTIFGKSGLTGSFLIEFWLYPSLVENGETIFNWRSSRNVASYPLYQVIRADIYSNRVEWVFDNVFGAGTEVLSEIVLMSADTIIPRKWSYHSLSYDDETGLLEYRIDGHIQALKYVTSNGRENGEVRNAILGVPAGIELCSKFNGCIDDFSITRQPYSENRRHLYKPQGGRYESNPLETSGFNSSLTSLDAIYSEPAQTDVAFYVRSGDNFYEWNDNYPEWTPVLPGERIRNISGKYFQVAAELYPDGDLETSPSVSQITLNYNETVPPLPPASIRAKPGNGYVDLSWSASVDFSVGGYLIYYGERPGEYLGTVAVEGVSPIDVGDVLSFRLNGLQNGRIYYFTVVAYSGLDTRIIGALSKEVYARPLRKTK